MIDEDTSQAIKTIADALAAMVDKPSASICTAPRGWRALYLHGVEGLSVSRDIAMWLADGGAVFALVLDDKGELRVAGEIEGFLGYCDPDDEPQEKARIYARARAEQLKREAGPVE